MNEKDFHKLLCLLFPTLQLITNKEKQTNMDKMGKIHIKISAYYEGNLVAYIEDLFKDHEIDFIPDLIRKEIEKYQSENTIIQFDDELESDESDWYEGEWKENETEESDTEYNPRNLDYEAIEYEDEHGSLMGYMPDDWDDENESNG